MDRNIRIQNDRGDLYWRKDRKVLMWIRRYKDKQDSRLTKD